jgi:hypothetical protein
MKYHIIAAFLLQWLTIFAFFLDALRLPSQSHRTRALNFGLKSQIKSFTKTFSTSNGVSNHDHASVLQFASTFSTALVQGFRGDQSALRKLLPDKVGWENPFVSTSSELKDSMDQFSRFFLEPSIVVFRTTPLTDRKFEIEYQLSFWYPMVWRPRIIIPIKATVTTNADYSAIVEVKEEWKFSVADLFTKQFMPRFWDIWHIFASPSPEYPPVKNIARIGKVSIVELPETVAIEVRWSGSAKYPGPPLLAAPGFSLFGSLRTSRPNRDPYLAVMPVEVQSGRYKDASTGEEMKRSSWIFHVPTVLQEKVLEQAKSGQLNTITDVVDGMEGPDDIEPKEELKVEMQNVNVMKSITAGALRGQNVKVDEVALADFLAKEKKEYMYKILPPRKVAQIDIKGEAKPEKIAAALKEIRAAVESEGKNIFGRPVKLRSRNLDDSSRDAGKDDAPLLGLQLHNVKGCFNYKAEPAMAIYEMQYGYRLTRVHVELEL